VLKIVFCIAVFAAFAAFGNFLFRRYRARKIFFENLLSFAQHLLVEISFSKSTVRDIIKTYGTSYARHFFELLTAYAALVEQKCDITRERIDAILDKKLLKPSECGVLADFFYDLGRHGAAEEKSKIAHKKNAFETFAESAARAFRADGLIALKLFILLGVGAVIILV
jgi:hypothetical protein